MHVTKMIPARLMPRASGSQAAPNSASGFLSTLIPNLLIAAVFVTIFLLLRVKYRRIYQPRTYLGALPEQKRTPKTNDSKFGWVSEFFRIKDEYVLSHHSLDGYLWLRFFRTLVVIFTVAVPLLWAVLMSVYGTSHAGNQQFDKISYSNIKSSVDGNRLYATVFLAWIFLGGVMYVIGRESVFSIHLRHAFMLLPQIASRISTRTVLFTSVPAEYINEAKLRETFGSIKHVWLPTDTEELDELVEDRDKTALKLEGAEVKLIKTANDKRLKAEKKGGKRDAGEGATPWLTQKDRPTHRLGKLGLYGKKVDTIDWSRSHIAELSPKIAEQRETHLSGKAKFNSAVFIEFDSVQAAQAAFYKTVRIPKDFVPRTVGTKPSEIIWKNLNMNNKVRLTQGIIARAIIFAMVIFWVPIVAFIGAVSNVNNLIQIAPWLSWINKMGVVKGIITGLLPVVVLAIVMALVPIIMRLLFKRAGAVSTAEVELKTQTWYFFFQVFQVFLVTTLGSGAASSVGNIIHNASQAPTLLASGLPKASNFYINYLVLYGLGGASKGVANLGALIVFLLLGALLDKTPRKKYNRYLSLSGLGWGSTFPVYTNIAVIVITYSCIAPLILGFAAVGFGLLYIAFRYNMIYSQDTIAIDTQGQAYAKAIKQLSTGVYLAQVCLIGLFAISTAGSTATAGPLALMVVFLVVTVLYQLLLNRTISTIEKNLGLDAPSSMTSTGGDTEKTAAVTTVANTVTQKPVTFLVKILRPPAVPTFDDWLSTPLPEYTPEIRRESYLNPAIWKPTPKLWIVRDEMGISAKEKEETSKVIEITDSGAWFDEKGKVVTLLAGPEDKDSSVNKAVEAPIWEEPVFY